MKNKRISNLERLFITESNILIEDLERKYHCNLTIVEESSYSILIKSPKPLKTFEDVPLKTLTSLFYPRGVMKTLTRVNHDSYYTTERYQYRFRFIKINPIYKLIFMLLQSYILLLVILGLSRMPSISIQYSLVSLGLGIAMLFLLFRK